MGEDPRAVGALDDLNRVLVVLLAELVGPVVEDELDVRIASLGLFVERGELEIDVVTDNEYNEVAHEVNPLVGW